jgi:hypothetical protein
MDIVLRETSEFACVLFFSNSQALRSRQGVGKELFFGKEYHEARKKKKMDDI